MTPSLEVNVFVTPADRYAAMREDVQRGLTAPQKYITPVWFYDEAGSILFDRITKLPEYYPTRTEASILAAGAEEMVALSGADTLVELGSGTSEKTRILLEAMAAEGQLRRIVLLDISEEVLIEAATRLRDLYVVDVRAVVGDFRHHLPEIGPGDNRLWAFLGSTVGNFTPKQRRALFEDFEAVMGRGDRLLLGADLVKRADRLEAAYNDADGVTAQFNLNVLAVINRELGANFDLDQFEHRAVWNPRDRWIEMRLRSRSEQRVRVRQLGLTVGFQAGEEILTEISSKFDPDGLEDELRHGGLRPERTWSDANGDFMLTLARPGY